jgi:hypothetical protein
LAAALGVAAFARPAAAQAGTYRTDTVAPVETASADYDPQYPAPYPPSPRGSPQYPDRGGYYSRGDYAFSNGYRDGYEKGFDDARDRDRYDPRRHRRYRDGGNGYRHEYPMGRDRYRDVYRRGFLDGYDAGYRDGRRGGYGYGRPGPYPPYDRSPRGGFWFQWKF